MKNMRKQLIKLLNIHAISGNEKPVRDYLKPILKQYMDKVDVDSYGNLLAEKKVGSGNGATVLLSAHMDTVRNTFEDRKLLENDGIITSDKGALGADDRAGIAIILEVLKNIDKLSYEGTLKIAFSREEEIGCVGSGMIDPHWYSDVNLAIVVDRKGNRDIVTGCCSAFCSDAVGRFFEDVSALQGMDWKCVEGGISDATTFSEKGINSVNLSAGYYHEHTEKEYVVLDEMKDTVKLILQTFAVINQFYDTFGDVPKENQWVKYYGYGGYGAYEKYYKDDAYYNNVFADVSDRYIEDIYAEINGGDVLMYEIGRDVVIQQGDNEIVLSRENLKSLLKQVENVL